ncbi:GMC family oxidoreductase [Myceligenerans halotolerans]
MDYDVLVIGSGFGGSVAALRLTEKGYTVGVLEAGRRFADHEFARNNWHLRDYLWAPKLGCFGIQRVTLLRNVLCLTGNGVGGGSLVYANVSYRPRNDAFFQDPAWADITDWKSELDPYYDQASRMLGVTTYHGDSPADRLIRDVAADMGVADTFRPTDVAVYFGPGGASDPSPDRTFADPFFGGAGPERTGCRECGECMTGCRHGAKNSLVKNYLYLAEQAGAEVRPLTTARVVRPLAGGGYEVLTHRTSRRGKDRKRFTAREVVFAAGTLGTQDLLHRMKADGALPHISDRLGRLTRTNSESLLGAVTKKVSDVDYSQGVAITSSIFPDEHTHVEPTRYGKGSNLMGALVTPLVPGDRPLRALRWGGVLLRHLRWLQVLVDYRRWSERAVIALVMQSHDNSLDAYLRRGVLGRKLTTRRPEEKPNPVWIPEGHETARRMADRMGGVAGSIVTEPFGAPMTAHIMGGCTIGASPERGVVDPYLRMYGHPGLHVMDGTTITANIGVNPTLTITAQAERACALWPNKGDDDGRPALGAPYRRISPVRPARPAVPDSAPAGLRLPIVDIT